MNSTETKKPYEKPVQLRLYLYIRRLYRLENGISVTTDIRATCVATMSVVFTPPPSTL